MKSLDPITSAKLAAQAAASLARAKLGLQFDPYSAYSFLVEVEGILAGGFTEVSGLDVEIEMETRAEGGVNDYVHHFPKGVKYSNITLKYGLTSIDMMWGWCEDVIQGKIKKKSGTIFLLDHRRIPIMWWNFYDAYPVKWEGPTFNASSSNVAIETIVLAHHGLAKPLASKANAAAYAAARVAEGLLK